MRIASLKKKSLFLLLLALVAGGAAIPGYAQQQNLVPLRLNVRVSHSSIPCIVAYEAGIFKKNGIDLHPYIEKSWAVWSKERGDPISPERVEEGPSFPFTLGGGAPGIYREVNWVQPFTVIIASHAHFTDWTLISRKDITKPEQLKGKRIGFFSVGDISHVQARLFAKKMGWDPDQDISLISMGMPARPTEADNLRDGMVDAYFTAPKRSPRTKTEPK